jgi:hypothetical protein
MLGTPRAGVTVAANRISKRGMIRYARGRISILHRKRLKAISGECYKIIKREFDKLLGTQQG